MWFPPLRWAPSLFRTVFTIDEPKTGQHATILLISAGHENNRLICRFPRSPSHHHSIGDSPQCKTFPSLDVSHFVKETPELPWMLQDIPFATHKNLAKAQAKDIRYSDWARDWKAKERKDREPYFPLVQKTLLDFAPEAQRIYLSNSWCWVLLCPPSRGQEMRAFFVLYDLLKTDKNCLKLTQIAVCGEYWPIFQGGGKIGSRTTNNGPECHSLQNDYRSTDLNYFGINKTITVTGPLPTLIVCNELRRPLPIPTLIFLKNWKSFRYKRHFTRKVGETTPNWCSFRARQGSREGVIRRSRHPKRCFGESIFSSAPLVLLKLWRIGTVCNGAGPI